MTATLRLSPSLVFALVGLPRLLLGQAPHLRGSYVLDPDHGRIEGNVCLSHVELPAEPHFLLANGLNVASVTDSAGRQLPFGGFFGGRQVDEATDYPVGLSDSSSRHELCITFVGAYPVYAPNTALQDWKGRIAFSEGTVRATEQSRWYPVLYDSATGAMQTAVTFDLGVRCHGCTTIYLNGASLVVDSVGRFASEVPRPILLYAGRTAARVVDGLVYLGASVSDSASRRFHRMVDSIAAYYAGLLNQPYGDRPAFLSFRSVGVGYPIGELRWAFASWPTLAFSGGFSFAGMLDSTGGVVLFGTVSHEMAHYYFGTRFIPHGPLSWIYLESTAEYLSLKAIRRLVSDSMFKVRVGAYLGAIQQDSSLPPLPAVHSSDQIDGTYRYYLAPLYLLALERRVGEQHVARMLQALLRRPPDSAADYDGLREAALAAGVSGQQWSAFEKECLLVPAMACVGSLARGS